MKLFIPAATEFSAKMVGHYFETGKLKPAPYNLTESLCRDFISKLPNGGRAGGLISPEIVYRPWPVEVDLKEVADGQEAGV